MIDIDASLEAARRQNAEGIVKTAEDLERYRMVIEATRPDGVIECGTFSGKSALWFAEQTCAPVVTIDVHMQVDGPTRTRARMSGVTFLTGRSTDQATVDRVDAWARDHDVRRPLVVLDSDHSADTVAEELAAYAGRVPVGGYCVVEDTLVRWMPWAQTTGGGPYRGSPLDAVDSFLAGHPGWENDDVLEGLCSTTQFPGGWLRRTV